MAVDMISITDIRRGASRLAELLKSDRPIILTIRNKAEGVILPLDLYNELIEQLQDAKDLQILQEVEAEGGDFQPYEEFRLELMAEGLLEADEDA
ncbi:MAG: type II toxin-antitoxin system Phd/YefM family antitoxin [Anaerolineae bacterium]